MDLAINNTGLFESLIVQHEDSLRKLSADPTLASTKEFKAFLEAYDTAVSSSVAKIAGNSIIDRISYGNQSLKSVYMLIGAKIAEAKKTGQPIDKKALKANLVKVIKGQDQYWFRNFWNIFELKNQLDILATNPIGDPRVLEFATKTSKVLEDIFNIWDTQFKTAGTGFYYNLPVTGTKGSKLITIDKEAHLDNLENLYIDMAPEGPYFLYETEFNEVATVIPAPVATPPAPAPAPPPVSPAQLRSAITARKAYSQLVDLSDDTKLTNIFNTLTEIENDLLSAEAKGISAESAKDFRTALEKFQTLFDKSKKKDAGLVTDKLIEFLTSAEQTGDTTYLEFFNDITPLRVFQILFFNTAPFTLNEAKSAIEDYAIGMFASDPLKLGNYSLLIENFTTNC